jgi:hypothetical protein
MVQSNQQVMPLITDPEIVRIEEDMMLRMEMRMQQESRRMAEEFRANQRRPLLLAYLSWFNGTNKLIVDAMRRKVYEDCGGNTF